LGDPRGPVHNSRQLLSSATEQTPADVCGGIHGGGYSLEAGSVDQSDGFQVPTTAHRRSSDRRGRFDCGVPQCGLSWTVLQLVGYATTACHQVLHAVHECQVVATDRHRDDPAVHSIPDLRVGGAAIHGQDQLFRILAARVRDLHASDQADDELLRQDVCRVRSGDFIGNDVVLPSGISVATVGTETLSSVQSTRVIRTRETCGTERYRLGGIGIRDDNVDPIAEGETVIRELKRYRYLDVEVL
ncbi:hypothetical protein L917_03317, partial [Phytophthora nicotianae]